MQPSMHSSSNVNPAWCKIDLAADIGEVGDVVTQHDLDRPTLPELWRENLLKRERKKSPPKKPENKRPESDHHIDDFA